MVRAHSAMLSSEGIHERRSQTISSDEFRLFLRGTSVGGVKTIKVDRWRGLPRATGLVWFEARQSAESRCVVRSRLRNGSAAGKSISSSGVIQIGWSLLDLIALIPPRFGEW